MPVSTAPRSIRDPRAATLQIRSRRRTPTTHSFRSGARRAAPGCRALNSGSGMVVAGTPHADNIDLGRGNNIINTGLGKDVISGRSGNDVIISGPESIAKLPTTTITLTGYGSVVDGVGAQA